MARNEGITFWHNMPADAVPSICPRSMRSPTCSSSPAMPPMMKRICSAPWVSCSTSRENARSSRAYEVPSGGATAMRNFSCACAGPGSSSTNAHMVKKRVMRSLQDTSWW